jgi:hypothetical protein
MSMASPSTHEKHKREKNYKLLRRLLFLDMLNLKKTDTQHHDDNNSSWCTLSIEKDMLTAKILHIGRGKFKILAAENGDTKYINNIVDASDVFSCRRE